MEENLKDYSEHHCNQTKVNPLKRSEKIKNKLKKGKKRLRAKRTMLERSNLILLFDVQGHKRLLCHETNVK